jgi:uncharacterized protein (DUF952 family)
MEKLIYKISPRSTWEDAVDEGVYSGSKLDHADGFIHFSTAAQVAETASRHFARQDNLVLVAIDIKHLPHDALKWEPSRGGDLFPHLYAKLPVRAALWVKDMPWRDVTGHLLPPEITGA